MKNFLERRNKIRRIVKSQKLDALLVTNPLNVRYLTGFSGTASSLLVKPDGDILLSDPRFTIQIEEECPDLDAVIRPRSESTSKTLAKLLGSPSGAKGQKHSPTAGKLGIEADSVTIGQQERLFQHIPHWQSVPTKNVVEELRQIKDKDEIAKIRRAVGIAGQAFQYVRENLQPSLSEIDICIMLEHKMRLLGAEEKSFPSIIAAGPRAALPHANPTPQILKNQSHLLFDWGAVIEGYMSDLTRVLILSPNKKLQKVYETVLQAQAAAIAAIKPGMICEEIDAIARNIIADAGFGKHFGHGLGHGIGLRVHEEPRFAPSDKTELKAGMILTVEPGIYLKGWGGVRIEDDVLVTKTGCEVLSRDVPKAFDDMCSML
ncbi:MAG: Xaa-Pro peptidase family protein [Planctomycetaceae bacterium]|nr:Xaa-Pro peptidase family protein [Planctomycetaceae bacterium]